MSQYAMTSRILHWLMAILLVAMLFIGAHMVTTLTGYHALVSLHRPIGIGILILAILRIINRRLKPLPNFLATMSARERIVATQSERLLYVLMVALPLVGWSMLSAEDLPIVMFGSVHLPHILPASPAIYGILRPLHTILAYLLFATFCAHLGGVLFHQLVIRDGILKRMVPWKASSSEEPPAPAPPR